MGVIYKIINPKGKIYIGKSVNLKNRIKCYRLTTLKPDTVIHKSIVKYGWGRHILEIIEVVTQEEYLNEREIFWIKELKTNLFEYPKNKGMNLTSGGDGPIEIGYWMKDKEKLRKAVAKRAGKNNWNYGKHLSEEVKAKIAKGVSAFNIKNGINVPKWGMEKSYKASRKPVVCYDLSGLFIGEYASAADAANKLKSTSRDIRTVASGKQTNCHGFIAKFKESEVFPLIINVGNLKFASVDKPIICINKDSNEVIEYETVSEAAKALSVTKCSIICAAHSSKKRKNPLISRANKRSKYIFIYKDLYLSQLKTA